MPVSWSPSTGAVHGSRLHSRGRAVRCGPATRRTASTSAGGLPVSARCTACGTEVLPGLAWRGVRGFERPRRAGGHHALALRRVTDERLCDPCMSKLKAGISSAQGSLVEQPNTERRPHT